ncbi:hypothetical protein C7M84_025056 [Penaeus vannamei]|uniref:Uncharacterized protein n=1 Tax=Penaeus vannamei TaxID=6689 RepID=A0A423TZC0_PENVA|nr:hypothetical protein C7M84_025056 [Penaeus vannamei]
MLSSMLSLSLSVISSRSMNEYHRASHLSVLIFRSSLSCSSHLLSFSLFSSLLSRSRRLSNASSTLSSPTRGRPSKELLDESPLANLLSLHLSSLKSWSIRLDTSEISLSLSHSFSSFPLPSSFLLVFLPSSCLLLPSTLFLPAPFLPLSLIILPDLPSSTHLPLSISWPPPFYLSSSSYSLFPLFPLFFCYPSSFYPSHPYLLFLFQHPRSHGLSSISYSPSLSFLLPFILFLILCPPLSSSLLLLLMSSPFFYSSSSSPPPLPVFLFNTPSHNSPLFYFFLCSNFLHPFSTCSPGFFLRYPLFHSLSFLLFLPLPSLFFRHFPLSFLPFSLTSYFFYRPLSIIPRFQSFLFLSHPLLSFSHPPHFFHVLCLASSSSSCPCSFFSFSSYSSSSSSHTYCSHSSSF